MNQGAEKRRKKVLFLITKATWGGAQRYVYDLATHLPKDQFDVSVAYGQPGRLEQKLTDKNIPLHSLPALSRDVALFSDIASFFQILALLRRERPDVLHVNSSKAAALGALAARLAATQRIIFTAHGWPFKEDRNPIAKTLIYFISWFTALLSHATIVVSKRDETIGKHLSLISAKIYYIPLGIESPAFLSREEASAALSIITPRIRIVSIGELTRNKGHRFAIDAIAYLKKRGFDMEYFIIGDGELRTALEARVQEQDVKDRVYFLGLVENASIYLKAFDLFLLPSIKEGMPYVLLEARAACLPTIATSVVDGYTAKPADANALAAAIEQQLLENASKEGAVFPPLAPMITETAALY